jgi:putative salt-induced outer membrane protein YdiY
MRKEIRLVLSLLSVLFIFSPLRADEAGAVKKWNDQAEVSVVSTNGNSKTTTTSGKNSFEYGWTRLKLGLSAEGLGAKSRNEVTAERYAAGQKLSYKVSPKNYVFEKLLWEKNRFAGIANRWDLSLGAGRELFAFAKDALVAELGFGYINEERIASKREDFASGRLYSKYTHLLSDTANFSQDAEYLANFEETDGYRLNTETALTAAISSYFSVKFSYVWNRVNKPAPGFTKNDTTTKFSLIASF